MTEKLVDQIPVKKIGCSMTGFNLRPTEIQIGT